MSDSTVETVASCVQSPPGTVTEPKTRVYGTPFTSETAKLLAQRSVASRRAKAEQAKREALEEAAKEAAKPEPEPTELGLVQAQLKRLSVVLLGKLTPKERCELLDAFDRLLDRARIIRGTPLPGTATSRAPAAAQSPASSMLTSGSVAPVAQDARPPREDQE